MSTTLFDCQLFLSLLTAQSIEAPEGNNNVETTDEPRGGHYAQKRLFRHSCDPFARTEQLPAGT